MQEVILYTPYFRTLNNSRQEELDRCLETNVSNQKIHKIVLLVDDNSRPKIQSTKIEIVETARRPTYADWIRESALRPPHLSILTNSDIYFDKTISNIREFLKKERSFIALSRYEHLPDGIAPHPNPAWSQDTWAYSTDNPIDAAHLTSLEFPLGVPRCDNKVAYVFAIRGWSIYNPMTQIKSYHLHNTQLRTYSKHTDVTVLGGVAYVQPTESSDKESKLELATWAINSNRLPNPTINHSIDKWLLARATAESTDPKTHPARSHHDYLEKVNSLTTSQILPFAKRGLKRFSHLSRFEILELDKTWCLRDTLSIKQAFSVGAKDSNTTVLDKQDIKDYLKYWIHPITTLDHAAVRDKPRDGSDLLFWQYPASTERQAFINHANLKIADNASQDGMTLHTYIGMPWATFIDKKAHPSELIDAIRTKISGALSLCSLAGIHLRVHTVCQHIHWRRIITLLKGIGITDLHLSHLTKSDLTSGEPALRLHSWPLIAVNMESLERRAGLSSDKAPAERRYLASFVGANMKHYRSRSRAALKELSRQAASDDIHIEVKSEWHFNNLVYGEQVKGAPTSMTDYERERQETRKYNELLSNSIFSICPDGAGPNTLRLWESLSVGAIPIVIAEDWIPPIIKNSPVQLSDCCVFLTCEDIPKLPLLLKSFNSETISTLHKNGLKLYEYAKLHKCF